MIVDHAAGRTGVNTDPALYLRTAPQYVDAMYAGGKSALRPIHDALSFGAEARPWCIDAPMFANSTNVTTVRPDASGQTRWTIVKGLLHGGILEANSGSPVFDGERLVGLVESSPGVGAYRPLEDATHGGPDASTSAPQLIQGVVTSVPQTIRAFLDAHRPA
jgi:hypothetical protein